MSFDAYIICTTPRSGSTMLCDMLAAAGAGRPASYFRAQDVARWAAAWAIDTSGAAFDARYVAAMREAGSAGGLFGLRLMHGSLGEAQRRLGGDADAPALFARSFGRVCYIHLSRGDRLAQAISLAKAEQSGLWHVAADGSERQRTAPARPPVYNRARIAALRDELTAEGADWQAFFADHKLMPLRVSYEQLAAEPVATVARILTALGRDPGSADAIAPATSRMSDAVSLEWRRRFLEESGG